MRKELHKALVDGVIVVKGRVYPLMMPQDTEKDSITYRVMGTADTTGISCPMPIKTRFGVQIDIFAKTYGDSVAILEKVKEVLRTNFYVYQLSSFEDYQNITLKYRQIIDVGLESKKVKLSTAPTTPLPPHIINHGVDIYNNGKLIINT